MRAITIREPYASLIAHGEKRIETRTWAPSYRGPLLIHAAVGRPEEDSFAWRIVRRHGLTYSGEATRGKIVAVAWLATAGPADALLHVHAGHLPFNERELGWYGPGRCGLLLERVVALPRPIPARGALSLWVPPPDVVERVRAQTEIPGESAR